MLEATLYVLAGTILCAGLHHLYHGFTRTSTHRHLQIGAMYLLLAGFALTSALFHQSQEISTQLDTARLAVTVDILLWGALIWYVAFYTNCKPLLLLDVLTAAWVIFLIRNMSADHGLLNGGSMDFAWYPEQALPAAGSAVNDWWIAIKITTLASLLFSFYASFRMFRYGDKQAALVLVGGLSILAASALAGDLLNRLAIHTLHLAPLGFIGFLLANSLYAIVLDYRKRREANHTPLVRGLPFQPEQTAFDADLWRSQASADEDPAALVPHCRETATARNPEVTPFPAGLATDEGANAAIARPQIPGYHPKAAVLEMTSSMARRIDAHSQRMQALGERIRIKAIDTRRMASKLSRIC